MTCTWDDFFSKDKKIAIFTGHKHMWSFAEELRKQIVLRNLNIRVHPGLGASDFYKDTLCYDLYYHNHNCLGFAKKEYFEANGYDIVQYEDLKNDPEYDFNDFETFL